MNVRRVLYAALAALVVAIHVLLVGVGAARTVVWLGGVATAGLLVVLVAAHAEGVRRLAARRRGDGPAAGRVR